MDDQTLANLDLEALEQRISDVERRVHNLESLTGWRHVWTDAKPRLNYKQRLLLIVGALLHFGIGVFEMWSEEENYGHKASAWQLLFTLIPEHAWDAAWVLVGCTIAGGWFSLGIGRTGLYGSALLFTIWSAGSWWSFLLGYGATNYGSLSLSYLAFLQATSASMMLDLDNALDQADVLRTRLEQAVQHLLRVEQSVGQRPGQNPP